MQPSLRHQCLIYSGSPARHLPAMAALMRRKLEERHRCLYLDSPPMVAGIRSYLSAAVDVARERAALSCHQIRGIWWTGVSTWTR